MHMGTQVYKSQKFLVLWKLWTAISWYDDGRLDIGKVLFSNPFDKDWMYSRSPRIRDIILPQLIASLLDSLECAQQEMDVVRRIVSDGVANPEPSNLLGEYLLLTGHIAAAEKLLAQGRSWTAGALRGWAACVRGRRDDAVLEFENAIRLNRKETRKRQVVLPPRTGAIYVISLVGSTDPAKFDKAHKYLDLALRKRPPEESPLYNALRGIAHFAEGKTDAARESAKATVGTGSPPAVARVLTHTALCGILPELARKRHLELRDVWTRAVQNGYLWVALEISRIRATLFNQAQKADDAPYLKLAGSCSPLLDEYTEKPAWERTLEALANISELDASGAKQGASRLTWRIDGSGRITPYHQVLSKKGSWTKGRSVALRRLHDRQYDGPLTPNDQRICGAIVAESSGYYGATEYSLDLARALADLVGHPHVFRSDDTSVKVAVVNAEPRLRIVTRKQKVLLQVVPKAPKEGSTAIEFESPSRVAGSVFRPKHRRILDVIGRNGLTVPLKGRPSIVRAISAVSKLVAVHSDIDSGQAGSVEVPADPASRFNITPYGEGLRVEPRVVPFSKGGPAFRPGKGARAVFATVEGRPVRTARNLRKESRRLSAAVSACPTLGEASWDGNGWILDAPASCLELLDELHRIRDKVTVAWPQGESLRIRHRATPKGLSLKIRGARDWFQISGSVETDTGLVLELQQLLASTKDAVGRFIPLGDGGFVALTDRFLCSIQELAAFANRNGKDLKFHRARARSGSGSCAGSARRRRSIRPCLRRCRRNCGSIRCWGSAGRCGSPHGGQVPA